MTGANGQPAVIVAVKGTVDARATIKVAADEARLRGARLIAVIAYAGNPALGAPAARPVATLHTTDTARLTAESTLRAAVREALGDQADEVEHRTLLGPAGRSLLDTAREVSARLIVLTGQGATSTLPGSVTQHVLRKSPCPVLIVPESQA